MSLWQMAQAAIATSISPGPGGSRVTSSMTSRPPNARQVAARLSLLRARRRQDRVPGASRQAKLYDAKTQLGFGHAMAYGLPPLNWLRAFEASARHLSFSRAAGDLNLTATAVSHQVRSLERHLRHPLFERLPRGLRLTEMGAAYLPYVRRAFEDLSATTTKLFGQS